MDRRSFLLRGGSACICCSTPVSISAQTSNIVTADGDPTDRDNLPMGGCYLLPSGVRRASVSGNAFAAETDTSLATGNSEDDRRLGRALVRASDFFSVNPAFGFYSEMNAQASPALAQNIRNTWGTVLFGTPLYKAEMTKDNSGMTVIAIVAHEFAHIVQFKNNLRERILFNQPTVKRLELHADILAGYYIGTRKRLNPDMSVYSAGEVFYRIGDSNFNSRNHHGTPSERAAASQFGFDLGKQNSASLGEVINRGMSFVSRM